MEQELTEVQSRDLPAETELVLEPVKETIGEVAQRIAAEHKAKKNETVELKLEDKFSLSQAESSFLKVQVELQQHQSRIQSLQTLAKEIQDRFKISVDKMLSDYKKDPKDFVLDVSTFVIRKRTEQEKSQ